MKLTRNPNLTSSTHGPSAGDALQLPWTGKTPADCPGFQPDGTLTSLPLPNLATCTRQQVRDYFDNTWTLTEVLFSGLDREDALYTSPYHQLRHPLVFYYGHPPVLYVNKLRVAGLIDEPLDPYYETLFETGVDEMSWDDMSKNDMEWPALEAVIDYRRRVYAVVSELIEGHPGLADGHAPITMDDPLWALFLGFEHERIHLETSSVLIRELPAEWLRRPAHWPADAPERPERRAPAPEAGVHFPDNALVEVEEGVAQLGKPRDWPSFGWDNEYGADTRAVPAFRTTRYLISNGEFHAFVAEGGYREQRHWTQEGWRWRTFRNVKWPTFWVADGPAGLNQFKLRTTFEIVDMPWSWPAVVNYHEAKAYANWRSQREGVPYRLPTEGEWGLLRARTLEALGVVPGQADLVQEHSGASLRELGVDLNLAYGSEGPVDGFASTSEVHDTLGNVWRWVEDDFHGLPEFKVHPLYEDFSTPCYDGEHTMILGGAFVSTGDEASVYARFHFRPHFFQHAGFRLVVGEEASSGAVRLRDHSDLEGNYEQHRSIARFLEMHYAPAAEAMPFPEGPQHAAEFPRRCAELIFEVAAEHKLELKRAIDVGCGVGRASFELARRCEEVLGVDLSAACIDTCQTLKREGSLSYEAVVEGTLTEPRQAVVDPAIGRKRVAFRRADALCLPPELIDFDVALVANLIDRVASPASCLRRMGGPRGLVRLGGLLVVTSPYSWSTEYSPEEVWLGGVERDGATVRSRDGLQTLLEEVGFERVRQVSMPFLIRETGYRFELVFSHATVWRRVR